MAREEVQEEALKAKPAWLKYVLIVLIVEKIIQHIVVTLALTFDWRNIRSTVAVDPGVLIVSGAVVAILFMVSLWGVLAQKSWTLNLVIGLALFDMLGEFVAQGRIIIVLNVSFIVATLLLILALIFRRQRVKREKMNV